MYNIICRMKRIILRPTLFPVFTDRLKFYSPLIIGLLCNYCSFFYGTLLFDEYLTSEIIQTTQVTWFTLHSCIIVYITISYLFCTATYIAYKYIGTLKRKLQLKNAGVRLNTVTTNTHYPRALFLNIKCNDSNRSSTNEIENSRNERTS